MKHRVIRITIHGCFILLKCPIVLFFYVTPGGSQKSIIRLHDIWGSFAVFIPLTMIFYITLHYFFQFVKFALHICEISVTKFVSNFDHIGG